MNHIRAQMQMLSMNITGIRWMPSFLHHRGFTEPDQQMLDMTNHLMHEKDMRRKETEVKKKTK